jgi:hypothetical protein
MVVRWDAAEAEQRLGGGSSVDFPQALLMRQEGGALREEHRERRHGDIGERIADIASLPRVGEALAASP